MMSSLGFVIIRLDSHVIHQSFVTSPSGWMVDLWHGMYTRVSMGASSAWKNTSVNNLPQVKNISTTTISNWKLIRIPAQHETFSSNKALCYNCSATHDEYQHYCFVDKSFDKKWCDVSSGMKTSIGGRRTPIYAMNAASRTLPSTASVAWVSEDCWGSKIVHA